MKNKVLAILAVGLLAGPMAALAVPITIDITSVGINSSDFGFGSTDTGSLRFVYTVDSSWFVDTNAVDGVSADISFSTGNAATSFSITGWVGPVSRTTFVENTATREILTYTANNLSINGDIFQLIATSYLPEGLIPFDSSSLSLLPFNISERGVRIRNVTDSVTYDYANLSGTGTVQAVPEPAALVLFGLGLAGLGFARRRKHT